MFLPYIFIGEDHFHIWVFWGTLWATVLYWTVGGMFLFLDVTNKPAYLRKYKTQPGTNEPLEKHKMIKV